MVIPAFNLARPPRIIFGAGRFQELGGEIAARGRHIVLVMGGFVLNSEIRERLSAELQRLNITVAEVIVASEPSPELVDAAVSGLAGERVEVVVAVGGGSALDAGKAISAMLPLGEPVLDYLEGAGSGKKHPGLKLPFIAVPTTAGTGTEATKNASLRRLGRDGFKSSLRHDHFVPDLALVDPELARTCPPQVTAACGMDAMAQLLESYLSPQASPVTDALAAAGLEMAGRHLLPAWQEGAENIAARSGMACAALLSGITLANAGLGIVHSLAAVAGGLFDIPHGVICGTLTAAAVRVNLRKIRQEPEPYAAALGKYARAGALLAQRPVRSDDEGCELLLEWLETAAAAVAIPTLGDCGVTAADVPAIAGRAAVRSNPVPLSTAEIEEILLLNLRAG